MTGNKNKTYTRLFTILCVAVILFASLSIFAEAGGGRGRRGGGSPPPPPPCPIQSAGCYKSGDIKSGFGELATSDFRYYLSENKCKRSGNCDCRGVPDNIPQETNPDDSSGACNCIAGTDWNAKAKCCGDDVEDCGRISSGVLCSIDANGETSQWLPSTPNLGDIRYVGCSRLEYLSDGNNWLKCEGTFWRRTVGNSEYACIGRGRESIVECCGDGSCKSRVDGKRLSTGQSVNPEKFENEPASTFKTQSSLAQSATATLSGICEPIILSGMNECGSGSRNIPCYCPSNKRKNEFKTCANWPTGWCFEGDIGSVLIWSCVDSPEYPLKCSNTPNCPQNYKCSVESTNSNQNNCRIINKTCSGLHDTSFPLNCGGEIFTRDQCTSYCINGGFACPPEGAVINCVNIVCNPITGNVVGIPANPVTGYAVSSGDTKTYYCRSDRKFVTDLDVPASQAKDRTLLGKNAATCEKAGFKWTGTKCCSEDDDPNEYYNDPGTIGGCWDKKFIESVSFVDGTDDSVVSFKGEFHGCAIDKTNFNKNNDNLLGLVDKHTGGPLITNHDYCFNDPDKNYFCSYTEKWIQTDGTDKTHVSFAPVQNPKQVADCCATDECWDGQQCVENQRNNPLALPINGFRCIDGEWTDSELRVTIDQGAAGYCPEKTQCLANVFGKDVQSQCLESGDYFDDNYCEDGQWSTRTKLLALKLLKLKSGDFTLFCDNRENALNNLQYLTDSNEVVSNILTNLKTNNFCVLKTSSKIIATTSINTNLEEIPKSSLNIFGVTSCDDALIDDGQYHSCDATNKAWFNKRLKSFIYSASAITIPSEQNLLSSFDEFIGNSIKNIINAIKRLIISPPFDESYLKGVNKFDKLYITQQGSKTIRGTIEGTRFKNAVIEYTGFETDICKFVEQFSQAKKDVSSGLSCKKEGNNYYVLVQGSQFTNINPDSIWPDLTSKLRLK